MPIHGSVPYFRRCLYGLLCAGLLLLSPIPALAADVTLAWNPNDETSLAGYILYHGTTSGTYTKTIDVGNVTNFHIENLADDKSHYFAATAYDGSGNESGFSEEIVFTPATDTDGDGLSDYDEVNTYGSDPNNSDTDGDGIADGEELAYWGSQWDDDLDHDGSPNLLDDDADGDGFSDGVEVAEDADPARADSKPDDADALQITLAWDASTAPDVAGYHVYYGTASRNYDTHIDVGNQTSCVVSGLSKTEPYYFAATAYDGAGNESEFSEELRYPQTEDVPLEIGTAAVDHTWKPVAFEKTFVDPVVVATPASYNGGNPSVVRIRNITAAGFELRIQEYEYLDDWHVTETVGYIVVERGRYTLPNGAKLEAGRFQSDSSFASIAFATPFAAKPVVAAGVCSCNDLRAVAGRVRNIHTGGFKYKLQEQEANAQDHATETVSYIAWEPSAGTVGNRTYEVGTTADAVRHDPYWIAFQTQFPVTPVFIADMQTTDGGDTAALRYSSLQHSGVEIQVCEEQSKDSETGHTTEVVGYMVFSQ